MIQPRDEQSADAEFTLGAGDILTAPKCEYWFYSLGDEATKEVKVFELPEQVRRRKSPTN